MVVHGQPSIPLAPPRDERMSVAGYISEIARSRIAYARATSSRTCSSTTQTLCWPFVSKVAWSHRLLSFSISFQHPSSLHIGHARQRSALRKVPMLTEYRRRREQNLIRPAASDGKLDVKSMPVSFKQKRSITWPRDIISANISTPP